jgi:Arc/MetJ family transcription regulator
VPRTLYGSTQQAYCRRWNGRAIVTITRKYLERQLEHLTDDMRAVGHSRETVERLSLQHGSKTYGRAFRLYLRDPKTGGLSNVPGMWNDGYLGMTKTEAVHSLDMIRTGLRMTMRPALTAAEISNRFAASQAAR